MIPLIKKRARLGACLAISNLGHQVPGHAASNPDGWSCDPVYEVECLAGHLMESRQHERIFAEEARGWFRTVSRMPKAEILRVYNYPWVHDIVNA